MMAQTLRRNSGCLLKCLLNNGRASGGMVHHPTRLQYSQDQPQPVYKPPFTFQADVGLDNLHEILDLIKQTPSYINNQFNSPNMFKAMTAYSSFEKPWWTTRDSNGNLCGFVLRTFIGEKYSRMCNMFVSPLTRGHDLAYIMCQKCVDSINVDGRSVINTARESGLAVSKKFLPDLIIDEKRSFSVRYGVPNYDKNHLPESGSGFDIVPYSKENHLDQLVQWDMSNIHECPRRTFWEIYLDTTYTSSYVATDPLSKAVLGFGAIQTSFDEKCQIIGPLYADTDEIALVLLRHVLNHHRAGNHIILNHHTKKQLMENIFTEANVPVVVPCVEYYNVITFPTDKYSDKMYLHACSGITLQ